MGKNGVLMAIIIQFQTCLVILPVWTQVHSALLQTKNNTATCSNSTARDNGPTVFVFPNISIYFPTKEV